MSGLWFDATSFDVIGKALPRRGCALFTTHSNLCIYCFGVWLVGVPIILFKASASWFFIQENEHSGSSGKLMMKLQQPSGAEPFLQVVMRLLLHEFKASVNSYTCFSFWIRDSLGDPLLTVEAP